MNNFTHLYGCSTVRCGKDPEFESCHKMSLFAFLVLEHASLVSLEVALY